MLSTARIFCCFHPDFITDDSEKGYTILNTGKWVVEWDELEKTDRKWIFLRNIYKHEHFKKEFLTLEEAETFMNILSKKQNIFD